MILRSFILFAILSTSMPNVTNISKSYGKHVYSRFLEDIQQEYEKQMEEGNFDEVLKSRTMGDTPFDKLSKKEGYQKAYAKWEEALSQLEKERNEQLELAIKGQPESPLVKQIMTFISFELPEEQRKALKTMSRLHFKPLKEAQNESEAKLIEIDTEYEIKQLIIDRDFKEKKIDLEELHEKSLILGIEKMERMKEAALSMEDKELARQVDLAQIAFLPYQEFKLLKADLLKFAEDGTGKNETEEKIQAILKDYLDKKGQLYKEKLLDNLGFVNLKK